MAKWEARWLLASHFDWVWQLSMGWLRWVGSLKLKVSFAEYRLFYRALLQQRPVILRSLLIVAPPYGKTTESGKVRSEMALASQRSDMDLAPPKDGLIALRSAMNRWYVVKCVSQKQNWSNNKNQWYNILVTFISKLSWGLHWIKNVYSVISVIDKRLPGNTKKWTLVRSWLIRVQLVHSWAVRSEMDLAYQPCDIL